MDHQEEWRPIPSLPEYEASSLGRIRRLPWEAPMPRGGVRTCGGQPCHGSWDSQKRRFTMRYGGKTRRVAPLVCEAFHGPAQPGQVCMHGDEDSRNNRPENLSWGTQRENMNAPGFLAFSRSRTITTERALQMNAARWGRSRP